jgi:uncharacterized protein (DUF2249 family)
MTQTAATIATSIDVRVLACEQRRELIFSTFDALAAGTALELINDHDPKPLQGVFQNMVPGKFSWDYLEQGPALWRVAITKIGAAKTGGQCCGSCGGDGH